MDLLLNNILNLTDEEIQKSKIEFNMHDGKSKQSILDRWLKHNEEEKSSGTCCDCSFWGWYGKQKNFSPGQWAFSFARITGDEWLFVAAAEIVCVHINDWATTKILERFAPLFGRLIVKCKKGDTYSRYVFALDKYIDKAYVKEILPCLYSGERFEGYDRVHIPYRRLDDILNGRIMPTYYEALKKIKGVYCLTDTYNGGLYIGSATGEDGVAQRWGNYLSSKHGGNRKLMDLYKKKGSGYFENNFTFTLLEYFGLSYDSEKIIEREQYWKKCLDTIKNGYNDN